LPTRTVHLLISRNYIVLLCRMSSRPIIYNSTLVI
jgi:hypothetical protein